MESIRIAHSIGFLGEGGVERRRLSLLSHLRPPDFQHLVLTPRITSSWTASAMGDLGAEVVELAGNYVSAFDPRRFRAAARILSDWNPHIVHGAIIEGYTLGVVAGRLARAPIIILEETSDPIGNERGWRANLMVRILVALSTTAVGISEATADYLRRMGVPDTKINTISNGVAELRAVESAETEALRQDLRIPQDALVVGSVSRLDNSHKGITDLIDAFGSLTTNRLTYLVVVGEGPDRKRIESHVSHAGLEERVRLPGHYVDVAPWYSVMDVFALASRHEGFGLVVAEAMMACLPVVATSVGGIPEIVRDGLTGILVPARQPRAMSSALERLLNDDALRGSLGESGRSRASRLFTAERYAKDVRSLYESLIAARAQGVVATSR